ncbi:VLRF1 family aeRF1-type release factor [Nonomuraea sp. NPDC000554]|uniref:VLRF1 family aeRF1-type release factor n=1 Tax=Nonomuraea sp. NPDC000554 TaxID=3154259 RepID=UPI0033335CE7
MVFEHAFLRELVALKDEVGVVSLYVTADPREETAIRPVWEIQLRNELTAMREQVSGWPERDRRMAVLGHLDKLEPYVLELVDPAASGIGRVLVSPVSDDDVRTTTLQVPVGTCAVLESTAYVRPLVTAMATGAPAGIALISRDGVRLIDHRYGLAEDVYQSVFTLDTGDWRKMRGPASPSAARQSSVLFDKFQRRVDVNLHRYLHAIAPQIGSRVGQLRWTDLLLVGDPKLTETVAAALRPMEVVQADTIIPPSLHAPEVVRHVSGTLAEVRARRDAALVSQVKDAAFSGGHGVVGLGQTLALLNEGRVDVLLLDENGRWQGGRGPDGFLYPAGQVPPGVPAVEEPDLGERMIERALESGAQVTILTAQTAAELADHDGVAAHLRW